MVVALDQVLVFQFQLSDYAIQLGFFVTEFCKHAQVDLSGVFWSRLNIKLLAWRQLQGFILLTKLIF